MNEPSLSVRDRFRSQWARLRERARKTLSFLSGVLAALLGLILYNAFVPGAQPLTQTDDNAAISNALASATPRPAFSSYVYQVIQPSLVWIEAEGVDSNGESNRGLGTGVIIDAFGNILTSLHLVEAAPNI